MTNLIDRDAAVKILLRQGSLARNVNKGVHDLRALPEPPLARAMRELCEAVDAFCSWEMKTGLVWPQKDERDRLERAWQDALARYRKEMADE